MPGRESTSGIALCDWQMRGYKGDSVTAHKWDFAGQVITHSLHQFFFSERSVYVLVLTGRENSEREDAEYWLRLIRAFSTDETGEGAPVIVALNKWDEPGCRPKLDREALRERFPFIRAFVETDCQTDRGIAKLDAALCREVRRLRWVRESFPEGWDAVRRALTVDPKKRAHLSFAEFRALCARHGVEDARQQDSLAAVLHRLGTALNYRNDPRLREATVLLPTWLTKNVYALVRRAEKRDGSLSRAEIDGVLKAEKEPAMRDYLVRLMERFEIAYPAKPEGGPWLVPQALPDTQPKGMEVFRDAPDATRLRYTYEALPAGLVSRAIVRLHELIEGAPERPKQWANGAVLAREGARALLRGESLNRVTVTVIGPEDARRQLAGLCQTELRAIHADIPGLDPTEETFAKGVWVDVRMLELDEKNRKSSSINLPGEGSTKIDPTPLNNAYTKEAARRDEVWKPRAFVSYARANVRQRDRLVQQLKLLRNEGLLHGAWHDRMINPGEPWDETIQEEIKKADVMILLVTADMLTTDYVMDRELPVALKLRKLVIPVILEATRWTQTALGKLTALPEKGLPLPEWTPRAKGWKSVADGLAEVCKKLQRIRRDRSGDGLAAEVSGA